MNFGKRCSTKELWFSFQPTYGVGAMCRYVLILFPALLFAAHAVQGRRGLELAIPCGSLLLLCLNSLSFLLFGWVS